jgi:hypothetical protein
MTLYNQMPFPPHQGIPYDYAPPLLDGFIEPNYAGETTQLEPGYTSGPRFAFGGSSGVPMAVFQGIKHNSADTLYLGFVARYDPGFDGKDFVMVVLQPTYGAPSAADRRIDVFLNEPLPNPNPTNATTSAGVPMSGADPNDVNPTGPGLPQIRTNKTPYAMTVYQRTPGGANTWASMAEPAGMDCRVRSVWDGVNRYWSVELQVPTTGWMTLASPSPAAFGFYFNIGVGWTDAGGIPYVVQYPWPYDPSNPTSNFLADPAGASIEPEDWDPTTYGQGYIVPAGVANPAQGISFVNDAYGIGVLDGAGNITGNATFVAGHQNKMVARLQNTSPNTVPKVRARFRIADFGISGGLYSHGADWADIATPSTNPAPNAGVDIPPTPPGGHQDIELDWTLTGPDSTKFMSLQSDQCLWVQLDTVATVPPPPAGQPAPPITAAEFVVDSERRNLWFTNMSTVVHKAVLDASHLGLEHLLEQTHQVILQVATSAVKAVQQTPVERALKEIGIEHISFRPAMQISPVSPLRVASPIVAQPVSPKLVEPVRIDPKLIEQPVAPAQPVGTKEIVKPFLAENPILNGTIDRAPLVAGINPQLPPLRFGTWFTAVNAYQVLGNRTLTFKDGTKAHVCAYVGSYGYVAQHAYRVGETVDNVQLVHQLAGPNLTSAGPNMFRGVVAPNARIDITNTLRTVRVSKLPIVIAKPIAVISKPFIAIANLVRKPA